MWVKGKIPNISNLSNLAMFPLHVYNKSSSISPMPLFEILSQTWNATHCWKFSVVQSSAICIRIFRVCPVFREEIPSPTSKHHLDNDRETHYYNNSMILRALYLINSLSSMISSLRQSLSALTSLRLIMTAEGC